MIERLLEGVLEKLVGKIEIFFFLVKKCLIYWRLHCLFFCCSLLLQKAAVDSPIFSVIYIYIEREKEREWSNGWWFSLFVHLLKKFIRVGLIDLFSSWYIRTNDFARLSPDLRVIWKSLIQNKTLENLWVGFILFLTRKCLLGFDSNAKFNIYICKITSCRVMLHSNLYYHKKFHYSLS